MLFVSFGMGMRDGLVFWMHVVFIAGLLGLMRGCMCCFAGLGRCAVWSWDDEIVVFFGCRM